MSMATSRGSTVVGVFEDREHARAAIEALKEDGFTGDSISILSPDKQATQDMAQETGTHAGSGAATGAVAGGVLGGLGGWLVGIGALAIPGVGPFIAAGAFASALGGAAIGASVGAIAGALVGMGVPEEHAKYYEGEAKAGKTLVTVRADGRYDDAQRILREHGAYDVESRDRPAAATGNPMLRTDSAARPSGAGQDTLQLREEELVANKQNVETGQVQVGKNVVSEERTLDVPVTREEVSVERHPVDRRPSDGPIHDRGESIDVPVHEERVDVDKRAVVYEEVEVGKRQVQDTEQVSGTVRREEARVDNEGDVNVGGTRGTPESFRENSEKPTDR
ncbi:MAG: YsnF/AvaK domain-containing protein [Chloroflexi bacterium]|nr:YsnF/AvaK domain-containing protein [Chloroflexota bacterium]